MLRSCWAWLRDCDQGVACRKTAFLPALFLVLCGFIVPAAADVPSDLYTQGRGFASTDHIVSTSVFHWYTSGSGQLSGPWRPLEGRENWTGEPDWWQSQIKQMMAADIDAIWVHLIPHMDQQRINLFRALGQLRAQGYDVPKAAPFLDPMITWGQRLVDVATTSGKDEFVSHYITFFEQYYSVDQDPYADSYLQRINDKVVLDTWHVKFNLANLSALTRSDVESRLIAAFGQQHPVFDNGIRMVTTALNNPTLSFADEKVPQFEINEYHRTALWGGVTAVQLKGGYWDQNIRVPGSILRRDGGSHYTNAWNMVDRNTIRRAYIESWNEYDEGSGIYAANPGPPYIIPPNPNTDVWSSSGDPWEYVKTTAAGAAQFNDYPDYDASILWHDFPTVLEPTQSTTVQVVVRNEGDMSWTGANDFKFGQDERVDVLFGPGRYPIDDSTNEIPTYGGIFRGRPITFDVQINAPSTPGAYETHWQMLREHLLWFGQRLTIPIDVVVTLPTKPGTPTDAGTYTNETLVDFSWTESIDSVSGIAGYNCRIGTTPGGNQAYDGFVGNVLTKSVNGTIGTTYYCRVQGKDNVGNVGPWSDSSDGIMVVENAGVSVAAAKFLPDGSTLGMSSEVVTAVFGDCFYVQESGGIPGIRVDPPAMPAGLAIGKTVDVCGTMKTTSSGERYIQGDASVLD